MPPGSLPGKNTRRRNAPTIPTTTLSASGRKDPAPDCPYELAQAGDAWWRWAWSLPQALAWSDGDLYAIARRARLEDRLAALHLLDGLDLTDLLAGADEEAVQRVEWALRTLKGAATGALQVEKEMRELDGKFGLTAESLARLRWTIVADEEPTAAKPKPKRTAAQRGNLRAVDPLATAS